MANEPKNEPKVVSFTTDPGAIAPPGQTSPERRLMRDLVEYDASARADPVYETEVDPVLLLEQAVNREQGGDAHVRASAEEGKHAERDFDLAHTVLVPRPERSKLVFGVSVGALLVVVGMIMGMAISRDMKGSSQATSATVTSGASPSAPSVPGNVPIASALATMASPTVAASTSLSAKLPPIPPLRLAPSKPDKPVQPAPRPSAAVPSVPSQTPPAVTPVPVEPVPSGIKPF